MGPRADRAQPNTLLRFWPSPGAVVEQPRGEAHLPNFSSFALEKLCGHFTVFWLGLFSIVPDFPQNLKVLKRNQISRIAFREC
jgi:hypothetical protein